MVDELQTEPPTVVHCPWCSAEIAPALSNCPACGAVLTGDTDASLPGVTALDQEAISRARRVATPQRRNRLLSWISGDYDEAEKPDPPGSLSPPPLEVRREMLRLELLAEEASLRAQTDALAAEAALDAEEASQRAQTHALAEPAPDAAEDSPSAQADAARPADPGPADAESGDRSD
ncbi:MAG: hypothetical protein WEF51_02015 [Chloroflexota bacterium]